jgi:hypothetical protein
MFSKAGLEVQPDAAALAWMEAHPSRGPRVLAFNVSRCCGGGRICTVRVRDKARHDDLSDHAPARTEDGAELLVDPRAAARLPKRFGLTLRGIGAFKHLDLVLSGEEWARLLYD